jgi:hypothetical protein
VLDDRRRRLGFVHACRQRRLDMSRFMRHWRCSRCGGNRWLVVIVIDRRDGGRRGGLGLDEPWRRERRRDRLRRLRCLLARHRFLAALRHWRVGKDVAGRQRDLPLFG